MEERLILNNARIFTCSEEMPWAEAAVIEGGRFVYVGDEAGCAAFCRREAEDTGRGSDGGSRGEYRRDASIGSADEGAPGSADRVIDCGDRLILPGLIDAHTHIGLSVILGGEDRLPQWDCKSKREILSSLKEEVKRHPLHPFYAATFGKAEALQGSVLRKEELDAIVRRRPVVLLDQECHQAWLNSSALKLLKVREDTPDPAPGYCCYERDEAGKLTGCVKEMAMLPLLDIVPRASSRRMKEGMKRIMDHLLDFGVTTVFDAGNYMGEEKTYAVLAEMDREGDMPIRMAGTHIICRPEEAVRDDLPEYALSILRRYQQKYTTDHLRFGTVKIMFDGTHRAHTAKMAAPYADTGTDGGTMLDEAGLYRLMKRLNEEGVDLHAHTVGEGASRMMLDCAERIREEGGLRINVTLAHLESQRDEDIPRFAAPGLFANFSPHWHGGIDYGTEEETVRLLGEYRAGHLLRATSMVRAGAAVSFSSDEVDMTDLSRWNPFLGMQIGHTRQEIRGHEEQAGRDAPVFPPAEEGLPLEELVKGYTIRAARQLRMEDELGSIEEGKRADFLLLDRDLFTMDPYELHTLRPAAVFMDGRPVRGSIG